MNVAVVGASNKPERYSHQAVLLLREKGHAPLPIHPALREVAGILAHASLAAVPVAIDTVTLYLAPAHQEAIATDLLACPARRVIFNPGTENPALADRLRAAGKEVLEACTLVLLRTGQF